MKQQTVCDIKGSEDIQCCTATNTNTGTEKYILTDVGSQCRLFQTAALQNYECCVALQEKNEQAF